ncbi:hypothetical protein N0M98_24775 [Paenibacillus doosanensis]|uniref:Topology modulation protein n=1 Tax=Paenibacillus konkukensis TaxID=2020716 RepID=A0ABY4RZT3_9BACL|nr:MULTISPECIES: hypothetical protein [Paenibacillus]MCS7463341.1 hypothetical protein [Paenibacillus doosanensis]UQZ87648.1 topology modulation protein [Paenibacillus konkukensis]
MKIRIIGCCGSGKTYAAKRLSLMYGLPYHELDNVVWDRTVPNRRHTTEERDAILQALVAQDDWIIEGVHYKWAEETFRHADYIFMINPNRLLRNYRVTSRFVKTRLGMESGNYKQTFKGLLQMYKWNRKFDREHWNGILSMTEPFANKRYNVRSNRDIIAMIGQRIERPLARDIDGTRHNG